MARTPNRVRTAGELGTLLRNRYGDTRRYAVLEQVANGTGLSCTSWVDFVVVCLWPSDKLRRIAFEVKVSRTDFLRELNQASKNAWARRHCHEFWFVAPSNVIKEEELPEGAGWMKPRGDSLATVRAARRNEKAELSDGLVASLCRSALKEVGASAARAEADVLLGSDLHQIALAHIDAVDRFLARGIGRPGCEKACRTRNVDEVDAIVRALSARLGGGEREEERRLVKAVLDDFQRRMLRLLAIVAIVADGGITASDNSELAINKAYGFEAPAGAEALRKLADSRAWEAREAKGTLALREALAAFVESMRTERAGSG